MYSVKRFFNHDKPLPLLRLVMDFSSRRNCSLLFLCTVIICVADKRISPTLEFLIKLIQYDVAQYWAQWSTLRDSFGGFLVLMSYHHSGIQVFMDKRNYSAVLYPFR